MRNLERSRAAPVLLLHGQPGGASDWDEVVRRLDGSVAPLAIARPGWDHHRPAGELEHNAHAALEALDTLGPAAARVGSVRCDRAETGVTVVGHSFGGAVAAWVAARHPGRVDALILVAPAANLASLFALDRWLALPLAGYLASASMLAGAGIALASSTARRLVAGQLSLDERFLNDAGRSLRSPSAWAAFAAEQRALIRELPALEASLSQITARTKIVIGSADRVVGPDSAHRLAGQINGAELIELANASHLIPQQRPNELAAIIQDTVAELSPL